MGAQWKHAGRVANSSKKSAVISKMMREVHVAARSGDPNPDNNARLRAAIEAAKRASVPRDTLDRALKKAQGGGDQEQIDTLTFEGFAPHQVPILVECMTENKNRTASDIRVLFRKGQLGQPGSVAWMFNRLGVVEATHTDKTLDAESVAIEAGAQNFEPLEAEDTPDGQIGIRFFTEPADLDLVSKFLIKHGWTLTQAEMSYQSKTPLQLDDDKKKDVVQFLSDIDDQDDVHRIYTGLG